jgi:hypothetical protein
MASLALRTKLIAQRMTSAAHRVTSIAKRVTSVAQDAKFEEIKLIYQWMTP